MIRGLATHLRRRRARPSPAGYLYLSPALAASSDLFGELDRDTPLLTRFVAASSKLVTDLAARRERPRRRRRPPVDHDVTAIGSQRAALADAIHQLPDVPAPRRHHLRQPAGHARRPDQLVDDAKPVARQLRPFLHVLRPLARDARPTLRILQQLIENPRRPTATCSPWSRSTVAVRAIAVGPVRRQRGSRQGALPATTDALATATPELGFARPYAPDLTGWFNSFGHSGVYDALGGASRVAHLRQPVRPGQRPPHADPARAPRQPPWPGTLTTGQRNRCPGSAEHPERRRVEPLPPTRVPLRPDPGPARPMRRVAAVALGLLGRRARRRPARRLRAGRRNAAESPKYWVELDNAFGLVQGGDMKVAGVRAGKITALDLDRKTLHALVEFQVTENGFGSLRTDVTCDTRPQSLIGEYYLDCEPGTSPTKIKPGTVIPVARTSSTVAPDLILDIFRLPLPRAPADHHQRARRRRGRQRRQPPRGHPPGQPGPARDRPGAGHPRPPEPDAGRAGPRRRPGASAPWAPTAGTSPASSTPPGRRRRSPPSTGPPWPRASAGSPPSSPSSARPWARSATWPPTPRRRCATSTPRPPS